MAWTEVSIKAMVPSSTTFIDQWPMPRSQTKGRFFPLEDAIISIAHNVLEKNLISFVTQSKTHFHLPWLSWDCMSFFPSLKHIHNNKLNFKSSGENELTTHFKGSGDSFVPERLICIRARELLKNCLKDGGTSFPFLKNKSWESDT